jgi:hypothetical protein
MVTAQDRVGITEFSGLPQRSMHLYATMYA